MPSRWENINASIREALNVAAIHTPVDTNNAVLQANVVPADNPGPPRTGNLIVMQQRQREWDTKRRRGSVNVTIEVYGLNSKTQAETILDTCRANLNARLLTETGNGIRFHLWKEQPEGADISPATNREGVTATFRVLFTETGA